MTNISSFTGDTYTLQEIADTLGVTRERARQIEMQALKKLKQPKLRAQWENIIDSVRDMNDSMQKVIV
jgi:DNA-directed RNA polymerase sigma subunit (sigma70/sigma32)